MSTPKTTPSSRVVAVGARADHARDQHHADEHHRDGRQHRGCRAARPAAAQAISATRTTWMLPSTVASPAPTASIEWCQKVRSAANSTPAPKASSRSRRGRGAVAAALDPGQQAQQRAAHRRSGRSAAVEGDTSASRTRIAEKAITRAPSAPASTGRSLTAPRLATRRVALRRRLSSAAVQRNTVLWTLVLFFGASADVRGHPRRHRATRASASRSPLRRAAGVLLVLLIILIVSAGDEAARRADGAGDRLDRRARPAGGGGARRAGRHGARARPRPREGEGGGRRDRRRARARGRPRLAGPGARAGRTGRARSTCSSTTPA